MVSRKNSSSLAEVHRVRLLGVSVVLRDHLVRGPEALEAEAVLLGVAGGAPAVVGGPLGIGRGQEGVCVTQTLRRSKVELDGVRFGYWI